MRGSPHDVRGLLQQNFPQTLTRIKKIDGEASVLTESANDRLAVGRNTL